MSAPAAQNGASTSPSVSDLADRVRPHEPWLRTLLAARTGECSVVDDLMQEIYLAVVRRPKGFAGVERVEPWLYRIAVRLALQHRRRSGRSRRKLAQVAAEPTRETMEPDPYQWLVAGETRRRVHLALNRLRDSDRDLLMLKHVHGWTYRDLQARLGLALSTIEYRLLRARQRLRQQLTALLPDEVSHDP